MLNKQEIIDSVIEGIKNGEYRRACAGDNKDGLLAAKFNFEGGFNATITQGKGLMICVQVFENDLYEIDLAEAARYAYNDQLKRAEYQLQQQKSKRTDLENKLKRL